MPFVPFQSGNKMGPGRGNRRVPLTYVSAFKEACKAGTWKRVIAKAVEQALTGNSQARDFLAKYLVGEQNIDQIPVANPYITATKAVSIEEIKKRAMEQRQGNIIQNPNNLAQG